MKTVKTAISVDKQVFLRVERLAKRLHVSRSRFFTQAALHMIQRNENLELIRKINAAHDASSELEEDAVHKKTRGYMRGKVLEKW